MGGSYNICSAPNCTNSRKRISNLPMFRVPKDPVRSKEWITNSGREELLLKDPNYLYDNIRFCAVHFEDSQFTNANKNRLIWSAVPTLFGQSSEVDIKVRNYQSLVNRVDTEKKTNRTFIVLKKLCLPSHKSSKRDIKPAVLGGKHSLRQTECQSSAKHIENKNTTNAVDKVQLLTKLSLLKSQCQMQVKQTKPKKISSVTDLHVKKLCQTKNRSLLIANNPFSQNLEKRKLCVQKRTSIIKTSKPSSYKTQSEALQLKEYKSSTNHIETKKDTKVIDSQDKESEGQSSASIKTKGINHSTNEVNKKVNEEQCSENCLEATITSHTTDEVDTQEKEGQCSSNQTETKNSTNTIDNVNIQVSEGKSLENIIENNLTTSTTDEVNFQVREDKYLGSCAKGTIIPIHINKDQFPENSYETQTTKKFGQEDIQVSEGQFSINNIEFIRTTSPDELVMQDNKGKSSVNCAETKVNINSSDEANIQEKEDQSSANDIETNKSTNTADKVILQVNEIELSANHVQTKGTTDPNDELNMQKNKDQSPNANYTGTKCTTNTTDEENIQKKECQSSVNYIESTGTSNSTDETVIHDQSPLNCTETKETTSPSDEANLHDNEGHSSENLIKSKSPTNSSNEIESLIKSGTEANLPEYDSTILLPPVKQSDKDRTSNATDKVHTKSFSPENNSLARNCILSQNKKKIKAVKRKPRPLDNSYVKKTCKYKPGESYSLLPNKKTTGITTTGKVDQVQLGQQRNERQSPVLLSTVKQKINNLNSPENVKSTLNTTSHGSSNSLLTNDEFSQYKNRVEAFKKKLSSPDFTAVNKAVKRKFIALNENESSIRFKQTGYKSIVKPNGVNNSQNISDSNKIKYMSSENCLETNRTLNPTLKIQIKTVALENDPLIKNDEVTKYKKKSEAFEKIIENLKTKHKCEVRKLKKVIKELRNRTRRKDFMISKLRKERKELKNGSFYVRPNIKPNFQRDRHIIEQLLAQYVSTDTLNIVMSQVRKPSSNFGNRWDDEVKMFAWNIFRSSPKAYRIICSYLHLPSTRTLQKFVQGADLMALSGLNCNVSLDVTEDNEDGTVPENSLPVDADNEIPEDDENMTAPDKMSSIVEVEHNVLDDSEILSSVVEVANEDILQAECIISQDPETENEEQIIYVLTGTDKECEVITDGWIPDEDGNLFCPINDCIISSTNIVMTEES